MLVKARREKGVNYKRKDRKGKGGMDIKEVTEEGGGRKLRYGMVCGEKSMGMTGSRTKEAEALHEGV